MKARVEIDKKNKKKKREKENLIQLRNVFRKKKPFYTNSKVPRLRRKAQKMFLSFIFI